MKNKKLFVVWLIVLVALAVPITVYASGNAQESTPPVIQDFDFLAKLIAGIVTAVVTFGVKFAFKEYGIDLTGKATQFTAAVVLAIYEGINGLLAIVPAEWIPVVVSGLGFLTTLLIAFGIGSGVKKFWPAKQVGGK